MAVASFSIGASMAIPDTPLRILQLTDTHLAADPAATLMGVNVLASLRRVVAAARRDGEKFDAVIATGDLVHDESAAGYQLLADTLAELNAPVYCLPGNHDDPVLMREALSGSAAHYVDHWVADRWLLLFLNTAQAGQVAGYLPATELARVRESLRRRPGHFVLLCLHHPPVAIGSPWLDAIGLQNGAELLELVAAHPRVRGVVWGHTHQEYEGEWRGARLLGAPSTCVQFLPGAAHCAADTRPAGYRWLDLYDDGRIDSGVRRLAL